MSGVFFRGLGECLSATTASSVAVIPCDTVSQGELIGGLGEKDRGWQRNARGRGHWETEPYTISCTKKPRLLTSKCPHLYCTSHFMAAAKTRRNEQELWSKVNRVSSLHLIHFIQRQPELSKTVCQAQMKAGQREGTPPVLELSSVSVAVWKSNLSRREKEFSVFRQHSGMTSVHL